MSWFSDLFKPKKQDLTPDKESWQTSSGQAVSDWAQKYLAQYQPGKAYTGNFTAGMAPGEIAGQSWLADYLSQPNTGPLYDLAKNEITKTLTDKYNPYTSPEYNAFKTGANLNLQDQLTAARRSQGARGSFFQSTGLQEENKLRQTSNNYLDQLLSSMSMQERQNKLNAVPTAMNLESYAKNIPLQKAQAATTIGSLPRIIEQADLEAKYNDFVRQQGELGKVPGAAQGVFSTSINYGAKTLESPSTFERIMGYIQENMKTAASMAKYAA